MKKFLSLVLALVMTMSLVTVASAKDYADASSITYVEAVDVLSTLGVLEGDAAGFRPNDTLKRSEAAKIICALNLTPDVAATLAADSAPFADVAKSHWAAGYIAEGVQSGIIAGVGNGKFAPDAELTGYAYLKMLLVSLGYDAAAENMTGANWSINVAKLAKKVGLTKGNDSFVGTKAVTREEAALYALNALQAELVEYADKGTSITIGDVVISASGSKAEGKDVDFMDEYYKDLTVNKGGEDNMGRPAKVWKYDGEKIGTYASTADYVVVLEKALKESELAEFLEDEEILEDAVVAKNAFSYNGEAAMKAGSVLEIFADEENVKDVVVINYTLGEVTKVSTSLTKAEKKDGATAKVTVEFGKDGKITVLDNEFAGFDYEKGDMILFVADGDEVLASELAESFEGEVTSTKSGNKVKIDGVWYVDLTKALEEESEGTFYLNKAGQIMAFEAEEKEESDDYAYIYNTKKLEGEVNEDGEELADGLKVYVVLADGTKTTYTVEEKSIAKAAKGTIVAYSIDDDEFVIEKVCATNTASISKDTRKVDGAFLKSSTEFVFVEYDAEDKTYETEVVTGYKNVKVVDKQVFVVANDDDEATLIFVIAGNGKVVADDVEYAVMLEDGYVERNKNEDGDYEYTYAVWADGEETEVVFESKLSAKAGDVVSYVLADEVATKAEIVKVTGTVESANDEYYYVNGEDYEYGDEDVITITFVYDEDGEFDTIEVDNAGEIEEDAKVIMIFDDDEVVTVYVYAEDK